MTRLAAALKSQRTRNIAGKSVRSSRLELIKNSMYKMMRTNQCLVVRFLDVQLSYKVKDGPTLSHQYEMNEFS